MARFDREYKSDKPRDARFDRADYLPGYVWVGAERDGVWAEVPCSPEFLRDGEHAMDLVRERLDEGIRAALNGG